MSCRKPTIHFLANKTSKYVVYVVRNRKNNKKSQHFHVTSFNFYINQICKKNFCKLVGSNKLVYIFPCLIEQVKFHLKYENEFPNVMFFSWLTLFLQHVAKGQSSSLQFDSTAKQSYRGQ